MRFSRALLIVAIGALTTLAGCRKEETIEQYEIKHPDREALQLRVAILPHGESVYFIRMSGPVESMKKHEPAFEELVKSVRFDDKKTPTITWTEPKDWKKDAPVESRIGSYRIESEPKPMEVKITQFPRDKYSLLPNIQRWQEEMNRAPAENEKQAELFTKADTIAGESMTWVTMNGFVTPKASRMADPVAKVEKKRPVMPPPRGETPFKFEAPAGWARKAPVDGITAVLYEVEGKGDVAAVTLTSLGGDGGGVAGNINRWRKQVGLPDLPAFEAVKSATPMKVAGIDSHYVDVANPKGKRTLGVIVPVGQGTWFVKMSGPHDLVGQHKNEFETFVKSFQLDGR